MQERFRKYILEACHNVPPRENKPSGIQRYVFKHYGYTVTIDEIHEAIDSALGLKRKARSHAYVNVVELNLGEEDTAGKLTKTKRSSSAAKCRFCTYLR